MPTELLLVIALLIAGYLLSCLVFPYTRCPVCKGGKHHSSDGQVWRKCWRCKGKGERRRLGALLMRRG